MNDDSAEMMFEHARFREHLQWRGRTRLMVILGMPLAFAFLYCVVSFAPPIRSILLHTDALLQAQIQGLQAVPDMQAKIAALNEQIKLLTTASVETRLASIETAIRLGNVKPEQV